MKSVNWPIVSDPVDGRVAAEVQHRRDPERGEEDQAREEARLDARLAHRLRADASALPPKRSRTSSSRPKACTISIPTTASSVASVRSPFFACTWREIGNTLWAKGT